MPRTPPPDNTDTMGGLVPYKNPHSLVSYYFGVFSLLPCAGFFLAPVAIVFGIKGLKFARENPEAKGEVHSWVGISLGVVFLLLNILLALLMILPAASRLC